MNGKYRIEVIINQNGGTIGGNTSSKLKINADKSGYIPIGIVGLYTNGGTVFTITDWYIDTESSGSYYVSLMLYNTSTVSKTWNYIGTYVLYEKKIAM